MIDVRPQTPPFLQGPFTTFGTWTLVLGLALLVGRLALVVITALVDKRRYPEESLRLVWPSVSKYALGLGAALSVLGGAALALGNMS